MRPFSFSFDNFPPASGYSFFSSIPYENDLSCSLVVYPSSFIYVRARIETNIMR